MASKSKKPAKPRKPLAAKTPAADPAGRVRGIVLVPQRTAGVTVNEDTALTLGAVFACIRVISEDIAGLPFAVKQSRPDGGSDDMPDDPANWLLSMQANPETPAFQWRETTLAHALGWGNGYSEIERDGAGRPVWLWQMTPDRVEVARTGPPRNRRVIYDVRNPREPNTVLEKEDVFHLRGLGFDGLVGYSVIRMGSRSIGLGIALEQNGSSFFANDSTPGGILKHKGRLSPLAEKNLRESFQRRHGGVYNRRTVAILEEGMDWQQTGINPKDAELVLQLQATPAEICRWFRVSPPKIADLLRATFANIEELAIWHVTDSLTPWVRRLETEANIKLFGRTNRGRRFAKVNLNALLRGQVSARGAFYKDMFDRGVFSPNDICELEDRNPIGPEGNKRFVPLNMQILDQAGETPPPPKQPPATPPGDETPPEDLAPSRQGAKESSLAILRPLAIDAVTRVLRRELNCMKRLARPDSSQSASAAAFPHQHLEYMREALQPIATAIAGGVEPAAAAALVVFLREYEGSMMMGLEAVKAGGDLNWDIPLAAAHWADKLIELTTAAAAAGGKNAES